MVDGKRRLAGLAIAATAAALFMKGCAATGGSSADSNAKVHCDAGNSCKGMSVCKTANSSCKGQNACKGQGFVMLTPAECKTAGGRA